METTGISVENVRELFDETGEGTLSTHGSRTCSFSPFQGSSVPTRCGSGKDNIEILTKE
jgi:hypothetical protein